MFHHFTDILLYTQKTTSRLQCFTFPRDDIKGLCELIHHQAHINTSKEGGIFATGVGATQFKKQLEEALTLKCVLEGKVWLENLQFKFFSQKEFIYILVYHFLNLKNGQPIINTVIQRDITNSFLFHSRRIIDFIN